MCVPGAWLVPGGRRTGREVAAALKNFLQRVGSEYTVPVNLVVFQRIADDVDCLALSLRSN